MSARLLYSPTRLKAAVVKLRRPPGRPTKATAQAIGAVHGLERGNIGSDASMGDNDQDMSDGSTPQNPWAVELTDLQHERIVKSLIEKEVKRGSYVCRTGESANYWYGVRDGLVKMCGATVGDRELTFIGIATGGWFGEGTLLKGERRKYDIVALRDTRLTLMPAALFLWLIDDSHPFAKWVMRQLNERLGQFIALLATDRMTSNNMRVARTLSWMFNPYLYPGMPLDIPITQEEIAHLAGTTRQRTNAALKRLAAANLVRVGYGRVVVLDIDGLRNFSD
jgi:CRP/FNR family transcriptional regulator, cyclic AMP receptor protein